VKVNGLKIDVKVKII